MNHSHRVDNLAKFLVYLLGRQPDEFGLVPDANGYVKTKELLKALGEEPGWRHVRMNHLREVIYSSRSPQIEMAGNLIRAVDRSSLFSPEIPAAFPKLLYYPVRQRAYPVLLEKGLPPDAAGNRIILAGDPAFARRLGRRIDPAPVILIVNSAKAISKGATLWRFGQKLFLMDRLPLDSFSGPPPPKRHPEPQKVERTDAPTVPKAPGSYLLDLSDPLTPRNRSKIPSRHRKNEWKRERKRKNRTDSFD